MPVILVQNDVTEGNRYDHWKDVLGERYHFPNQYKNKVLTGESFIYYRGSRRINNLRAIPEYFGYGVIGDVWQDEETLDNSPGKRYWFCSIEEYFPFLNDIPFKVDGVSFEGISENLWGVAVRTISNEIYERLLMLGANKTDGDKYDEFVHPKLLPLDQIDVGKILLTDDLLLQQPKQRDGTREARGAFKRYAKNSKLYGDRAEEIVSRWLLLNGYDTVDWVARRGLKPGWDIECLRDGQQHCFEVKGTSGQRFLSFDLTANELTASKEKGDQYRLILVAECLSANPKIQVISNPYKLYVDGSAFLEPSVYTFRLASRV